MKKLFLLLGIVCINLNLFAVVDLNDSDKVVKSVVYVHSDQKNIGSPLQAEVKNVKLKELDKHNRISISKNIDSFIFKVLLVIQFGSQGYASAIEDLWQKSNIPDSERANYLLVNTQEYEGIDWSILLCGEDYYSVIGDIVKIKQNPQSQQNNSLSSDIQKLKTVTAPIK